MYEQVQRNSNRTNLSQPKSTTSFGPSTFAVQRRAKKANQPQSKGSYSTEASEYLGSKGIPIQAKLTIGEVGDKYEQEADRVASQVVKQINAPAPQPEGQSQPVQREAVLEELQMKPILQLRASAGGMTAAPDLESSIQKARGRGQPLADSIREPIEQAFRADFSKVKVHTDAESNQMNQSIQDRAFTTGHDVFFRQGEYNPRSQSGQELIAHELTHVVQQNNGGNTIQRAVGFEFQTTWGVQNKLPEKHLEHQDRKFKYKSKRVPYRKQAVLHDYGSFRMTADEANTSAGSEIEWVVDAIQESQGLGALNKVMTRLQNVVEAMIRLHDQDKFTLDRITGNPGDSRVEVLPNIKGSRPNMAANPQVTGGVRLDQISNMFAQLGEPRRGGADPDPHAEVQGQLMGMGGAGILSTSAAAANSIPGQHSASFKGLAAQIIAYLKAGSLDRALQGRPGQAFQYAKLIAKIMARTDFGSQFMLLPEEERQPFENNPQDFANLILTAANVGEGNVNVFERKIRRNQYNVNDGVIDVPVTRNDWLIGITQGEDRLTRQFHARSPISDDLESLGGFGNRTDQVGTDNVQAPILEFRQVRDQIPYREWLPFATRVFEYLSYLNRNQSATQSAQSSAATAAQH